MMELNLNTSLWIAGGAAIVLVVIYNFWQEYRAKKNVERAFGQHQDDVLMQTSSEAPTTTKREPSCEARRILCASPPESVLALRESCK